MTEGAKPLATFKLRRSGIVANFRRNEHVVDIDIGINIRLAADYSQLYNLGSDKELRTCIMVMAHMYAQRLTTRHVSYRGDIPLIALTTPDAIRNYAQSHFAKELADSENADKLEQSLESRALKLIDAPLHLHEKYTHDYLNHLFDTPAIQHRRKGDND